MNITINNFKTIKNLVDFELKPMTILSGVNSSGKSSFIQLLLLLKQTIESNPTNEQFYLWGDLYKVKEYKDIIYKKNTDNKLKIGFSFNKSEFTKVADGDRITLFDYFDTYQIFIELLYEVTEGLPYIFEFLIKFILPEGDKKEQFIKFFTVKNGAINYRIETNTGIFSNELYFDNPKVYDIEYLSIFPTNFEVYNHDLNQDKDIPERLVPNVEGFRNLVSSYFSSINYIGPLRDQPRDDYDLTRSKGDVGSRGEYVAQVLENHAGDQISFFKIDFNNEDEIKYFKESGTLLEAVKYWMCDIFQVATDIYADKQNDAYHIYLKTESGLVTTVKHVGFGISQILPIIVQGLIKPSGTFVLEQPEIHLHPKLQSYLFDFLYALILNGKNIIIETHSDHFITRMRRRIAEDLNNKLAKEINLTFIEIKNGQNMFRSIDLDDFGTYNYFPDDFIEQNNIELKAIVKAQMRKRLDKKK